MKLALLATALLIISAILAANKNIWFLAPLSVCGVMYIEWIRYAGKPRNFLNVRQK